MAVTFAVKGRKTSRNQPIAGNALGLDVRDTDNRRIESFKNSMSGIITATDILPSRLHR